MKVRQCRPRGSKGLVQRRVTRSSRDHWHGRISSLGLGRLHGAGQLPRGQPPLPGGAVVAPGRAVPEPVPGRRQLTLPVLSSGRGARGGRNACARIGRDFARSDDLREQLATVGAGFRWDVRAPAPRSGSAAGPGWWRVPLVNRPRSVLVTGWYRARTSPTRPLQQCKPRHEYP